LDSQILAILGLILVKGVPLEKCGEGRIWGKGSYPFRNREELEVFPVVGLIPEWVIKVGNFPKFY